VGRPIRELDDAAKLYRELAKDATQANKLKIAKALKEIGLAKLNHKRTIIIHRNDDAPYDPLTDQRPVNHHDRCGMACHPDCPIVRWQERQDNYYATHPKVPRP
jgi:hypothetical protein